MHGRSRPARPGLPAAGGGGSCWGCWFPPRKAVDDLCVVSVNAVVTLLMLRTPAKDDGLLPLNVLSAAGVEHIKWGFQTPSNCLFLSCLCAPPGSICELQEQPCSLGKAGVAAKAPVPREAGGGGQRGTRRPQGAPRAHPGVLTSPLWEVSVQWKGRGCASGKLDLLGGQGWWAPCCAPW